MPMIFTTLGDMDESLLQRLDGKVDNENEETDTVEYCLKNCHGPAHTTGVPDSESFFCRYHIRRDAAIRLKKMPPVIGEAAKLA